MDLASTRAGLAARPPAITGITLISGFATTLTWRVVAWKDVAAFADRSGDHPLGLWLPAAAFRRNGRAVGIVCTGLEQPGSGALGTTLRSPLCVCLAEPGWFVRCSPESNGSCPGR